MWFLAARVLVDSGNIGTNGPDFTSLIQYGVLGLVTLALIFARLIPWTFYNEKKAEIDRLNAELVKERANTETVRSAKDSEIAILRGTIEDKIIPLSIRLLDVVERQPRGRGSDVA